MLSKAITHHHPETLAKAARRLQLAKKILFGIGVGGQWLFVLYIVAYYWGAVLQGRLERINAALPHGIIEGDFMGNLMLAIHIFLAAIITFGGPLQFFPPIRNRYPTLHRWIGRTYFVTAFLISGAGLYMIYSRGPHGGWINGMGNTLNASLIMGFSILAWRYAMQRDFAAHRKWAIRAFVVVSGVWFFRIGYGIWILIMGFNAPGTTGELTGPFDRFLAFGHTLVPLMILELYFYARASHSIRTKNTVAAGLGVLSLFLITGIASVGLFFWLPAF